MMDETRKYDFIDALRGWAILMVLFIHIYQYTSQGTTYIPLFLRHHADLANKGVQLFFVVSAYTLCLSFSKRMEKEKSPVLNFYLRRFFRIAPLFYILLIIYTAFNFFLKDGISLSSVLLNITFLFNWNPFTQSGIVPFSWTIGTETAFYMVFPILFFCSRKYFNGYILMGLFIVANVFIQIYISRNDPGYWGLSIERLSQFFNWSILGQGGVFVIGIIAFHVSPPATNSTYNLRSILFLVLMLLTFISFILFKYSYLTLDYQVSIVWFFVIIILSKWPVKLLVNPLTVWIGKLSYSMYLLHFFVLIAVYKYLAMQHVFGYTFLNIILSYISIVVITSSISFFSYTYIEQPFIGLGKRLINKFNT